MNYKKSIILSAISLGLGLSANAQSSPRFSLNGLGRSVITNDNLSGELVKDDTETQKAGISGYNLFDLQTNLGIDSSFQAMAVLRTRSPFGSSFGAITNFEFRQFSMKGKLNKLQYELGDIRVEMSPYTVFNNEVAGTGFQSDMFGLRQDILNYENFNSGNTWLLQGAAAQYGWDLGGEMGLGIYAFTTRTGSTNELSVPDRLLSGGRLEFGLNKNIKIGGNYVTMYDLATGTSEFDYNNHVFTGDLAYFREMGDNAVELKVEGGASAYTFTDNVNEIDTSYMGSFWDLGLKYKLGGPGLVVGVDARSVSAVFSSPTAQTRRIDVTAQPGLFSDVKGSDRGQLLFDRFTSEDIYNNGVTPNLMAFIPHYNNLTPYGKATPNRMVYGLNIATDTANKAYSAKVAFDYGTELVGEGAEDKRGFLVLSGGGVVKVGNLLDLGRLLDANLGFRYESTSRSGAADVDLTSTLIDFGVAAEIIRKVDFLAGGKLFSAAGNEFIATRDGFNLVTGFQETNVDINEMIVTGGLRIRFSKFQSFSLNYNMVNFSDNETSTSSYDLGQLFFNYTGRF